MRVQAKDIFKEIGEACYLVALQGNEKAIIKGMASFESGGSDDLVVIPNKQTFEKQKGKKFA